MKFSTSRKTFGRLLSSQSALGRDDLYFTVFDDGVGWCVKDTANTMAAGGKIPREAFTEISIAEPGTGEDVAFDIKKTEEFLRATKSDIVELLIEDKRVKLLVGNMKRDFSTTDLSKFTYIKKPIITFKTSFTISTDDLLMALKVVALDGGNGSVFKISVVGDHVIIASHGSKIDQPSADYGPDVISDLVKVGDVSSLYDTVSVRDMVSAVTTEVLKISFDQAMPMNIDFESDDGTGWFMMADRIEGN